MFIAVCMIMTDDVKFLKCLWLL